MKHVLLCLSLWFASASAFAQTVINVSFTWTQGAANTAGAAGTSVQANVGGIITAINAAYTLSNVGIQLQPYYQSTLPKGMPPDSASMTDQYTWAKNDVPSIQQKTNYDAAISIQISDPGIGVTSGAMAPTFPTTAANSVAAIPYAFLATQLEYAISKILGAQPGYATRQRRYGYQGSPSTFCVHSREAAPSDTSTPVPFLSYWETAPTNIATQAPTKELSCDAYRQYLNSNNHTTYSGTSLAQNFGTWYCTPTPGGSAVITTYQDNSGATPLPISCSDGQDTRYSSPSLFTSSPAYPIGDGSHDSVSAMNARVGTVAAFPGLNATLLSRAKCSWFCGD